jgi:hypothetical protein
MKYYLFSGSTYYAAGGAIDFIESSYDLEHLLENAKELFLNQDDWGMYDWYHIADEDMNIVAKSDEQAHC